MAYNIGVGEDAKVLKDGKKKTASGLHAFTAPKSGGRKLTTGRRRPRPVTLRLALKRNAWRVPASRTPTLWPSTSPDRPLTRCRRRARRSRSLARSFRRALCLFSPANSSRSLVRSRVTRTLIEAGSIFGYFTFAKAAQASRYFGHSCSALRMPSLVTVPQRRGPPPSPAGRWRSAPCRPWPGRPRWPSEASRDRARRGSRRRWPQGSLLLQSAARRGQCRSRRLRWRSARQRIRPRPRASAGIQLAPARSIERAARRSARSRLAAAMRWS